MVSEDHIEFLQTVWSRRPVFTYFFFGLNIIVFLLMALAGGSTSEPTLMGFGVKANAEIARGEWWRFLTPIFIHIGLLHLIFNSYALWIVGPQVEKLYGGPKFVLLYVGTGVAGVCGSYFYHPNSISAGASGAIFGLFGVLLIFGLRYRNSIPPFFKRAVGTGVLPVIVINLIIGFSIPAIDNSAHVGGLLAGAVLAAVVPFQRPGTEPGRVFKAVQIALLATVAICFYEVARNYDGPHLATRNLGRSFTQILSTGSASQEFIDAINTAQKTFETSQHDLETGNMDRLALLESETAKSIDQLRNAPSLATRSDELMAHLVNVMQDQYDLLKDVERAGTVTFGQNRKLKENVQNYEKVVADLTDWVAASGSRYGIQIGKRR